MIKKKCVYCGKEFTAKNASRKYCSVECSRSTAYEKYKRKLSTGKPEKNEQKCVVCGKIFDSGKCFKKYCCAQCRRKGELKNEEKRKRKAAHDMDKPRVCPVCGHKYLPTVWNQEGCNNPVCRKELKRRKARGDYKAKKRKSKKIKYGSKEFHELPFEKQWELMSLAERNDYARKQHKSYGQLQVYYYQITEGAGRCRKN